MVPLWHGCRNPNLEASFFNGSRLKRKSKSLLKKRQLIKPGKLLKINSELVTGASFNENLIVLVFISSVTPSDAV